MTPLLPLLFIVAATTVLADDSCPGLPICFCNKDKTSVNCEGKHLTSIPKNIPPSVVKLYLGYNQLTNISTGAFASFPKLERLQLERNKINVIQPHAFRNLSNLDQLDLRENKLITVGENAFSDMRSLKILYLITNPIQKINELAFVGTESLESLYLQSNALTEIPPLGNMTNLKKLILEGNDIINATFPACFRTIKKQLSIGLSNNNIKILSNDTFEALRNKSVSSLYLSRNALERIDPGTFLPLGSITSLKLGSNPLNAQALRTAIESLKGKNMVSLDISGIQLNGVLLENTFELLKNTSITTLNMRSNKISTLPNKVFSGLNQLLHLDLTSCQIERTSPASFEGLDKLTILILNRNKLINVPKNLPTSLIYLYLDSNEITAIGDKSFINMAYLQELRIRYNKIQTLEEDSFLGLLQLNKLSLYNNFIATLPGKVFDPLVRLISLDLENNNLASIQNSKGRFSSFGSLVYLNLANNKMTYIQPDIFQYTLSMKYLHLENNLLGDLLSGDFGGGLFKGLVKLEELNLMNNRLVAIPDPSFQDLTSLVFLNLTNNKITGWGSNLFKATQNLQVLDLTNNLVATLKKENLQDFTAMKSLNLTGNPFACNCDLRWFRDWMNKTSIVLANNASYRCNGPHDWAGKALLSFDKTKINCFFIKWWYILIASAIAVVIVIIISGFTYRKRWRVKLFFYKMTRRRKTRKFGAADGRGNYGAIDAEDGGGIFDAYISCAEEDKNWVLTSLLPGVDRGQIDEDRPFGGQFSLYFEERDSAPGRSVAGNIFENMVISRKVIVILSSNYLQSPMHMFEYDLAAERMYDRKLEEIIVVHIEKGLPERIPKRIAHTMRRNKVVEWSDDPDAKEHFKNQINDILGRKAVAADYEAE
ncbi:slit homolog 3 protein-like [Mercenaria mercenaria]|uniref:slit homolog 3 protein-like n=1 Tax=Mercenaria mercenaria TaxID=6596 RepID=UPI00234F426F|nr:slit homolog 3 protein-like [Mercenaria mercenaria]XP_045191889.2 slit homolog 3 protein-like [Mercenaria mercenaria]